MSTAYQAIIDSLDLEAAIQNLTRNDLIPPRPEDKVAGQLGARFLEGLRLDIERGTYDPHPAYFVAAPKSTVATRPAALMSLDDRVVFTAMVGALGSRIESYLLGNDLVFWPRGIPTTTRWLDFERSVLTSNPAYVVRGDITGFYEFVDHERLAEAIVLATGRRGAANALVDFLQRSMGSRRGLPQGLLASDALATVYVAELDFSMTREGFQYFRHGDDVRVGVRKYSDGRRAIGILETELRRLGLLLNGSKTRILRKATYEREVSALQGTLDDVQDHLVTTKVQNIVADQDQLLTAISDAKMDQLAWDFFYHGNIGLGDVIEKLRPTIKPSDTELATKVFRDAVKKRPGRANALTSRLFHQRLKWSLVRLSASRSTIGLSHTGALLRSFPQETETLCSYLLALASTEPESVALQAEKPLHNNHLTEWELAWIVRVLVRVPTCISAKTLRVLRKLLQAPHGIWLAIVEIVKLFAARHELRQETLMTISNICPAVFKPDLVLAAKSMAASTQWAEAFVSAAKSDRIQAVVASQADITLI